MKIITDRDIRGLNISPIECIEWIKEAFTIKSECQLPAKMSVHPVGNDFITTMPCLLPMEYGYFGVKVVSRVNGRVPALKSDLTLFDVKTGEMLALVDSNWITAMRTGAVATLAIKSFRNSAAKNYAFVGLGSMAKSTLLCLLESSQDEIFNIKLFRYKDQAEKVVDEFSRYKNVCFTIVDTMEELVKDSDVIVSCITDAQGLMVEDVSLFKPGVLVVPVHTRGFQNCDTIFEKVFADDRDHVKGFRYFSQFREFHQFEEVIKGEHAGRESDTERILSYNIGLGLHDVLYASKIYESLK